MAKMTSKQARELARQCREMARAIGDYLTDHLDDVTAAQRKSLEDAELELLGWSGKLLSKAIELRLQELSATLGRIEKVTGKVKKAIRRIDDTRRALEIAAAVIQVGRAIATGNAGAIVEALDDAERALASNG